MGGKGRPEEVTRARIARFQSRAGKSDVVRSRRSARRRWLFSRLLDAREKRARRTMSTNEGVMSARGWRERVSVAPGAVSGNDRGSEAPACVQRRWWIARQFES